MARNENSASRLLRLAERLADTQAGEPVWKAWQSALGVENDAELAAGLVAVSSEIEKLAQTAPLSPFPDSYYREALDSLRGLLRLQNFHLLWSAVKDAVRPSVQKTLESLAHTLPPDDHAPKTGQIEKLLRGLNSLEAHLIESKLEQDLVAVLLHYIQLFRSALYTYRVRGSAALRDAVATAAAGLAPFANTLKRQSKSKSVRSFFALMSRMAKIGEWIETGEKAIAFAARAKQIAGPVIGPLIEHGQKLLGSGTPPS